MKKLLLITLITPFTISIAYAQIIQKSVRPVKQNVIIKNVPPPPPPPAPAPAPPAPATNKSTTPGTQFTPIYSLAAVKANIRTGFDNKEYPSNVWFSVAARTTGPEYAFFTQENLKNEMKSNSNTEFGLEKKWTAGKKDISLDVLQNTGMRCRIWYHANFQLDAWKIEGVTVTLEFRDQNGNLHPTLGQKTITFSNANGFLNGYPGTTIMTCTTDGYFNPLSASIE